MSEKKRVRWWKFPASHPVRIHHEFTQAGARLRRLKRDVKAADEEPSQWEIELEDEFPEIDLRARPTPKQIDKAQERYDAARELWEAAGRPNNDGKRMGHRNRARLAELLVARAETKKHALTVQTPAGEIGAIEPTDLSEATQRRIAKGVAQYLHESPDCAGHSRPSSSERKSNG